MPPLVAAAWLAACAAAGGGVLAYPLTLIEQQSGFAGVTGVRWQLQPDGAWRATTYINDADRPGADSGKIAAADVANVARLVAQELPTLPQRPCGAVDINPHTFSIEFGGKSWTCDLPAGQTLAQAAAETRQSSPQGRFLQVVLAIRAALRDTASPSRKEQ